MVAASNRSVLSKVRGRGESLLEELQGGYSEVFDCIGELQQILSNPQLERGRLTTVRLKLAQLRLSHVTLVSEVSAFLDGKVEGQKLSELASSKLGHVKLLRTAAEHTNKWPLDAVEINWPQYGLETRILLKCWVEKINRDRDLLYPLLRAHS